MLLIPVVLVATISGLLLAPFYVIPQNVVCLLFAVSLLFGLFLRKNPRFFYISALLFFFLLANQRYPFCFPTDDFVERLTASSRKIVVTAELQQITQRADERSQLDLQLLKLFDEGEPVPFSGDYRLRLYVDEQVRGLLPGDQLRFKTRLRKPRLFGTPGEFHWPRYLASQGIAMTGWVKNAEQLSVVSSSDVFPQRAIAAWKERAAERIGKAASGQEGLLVRALLLGEARILPDAVRETLGQAGISHLFAISGLHLGLIGMLGYRLLLCLYRRTPILLNWQPPQRVLPLLLLPILLGYLLLTGDAVSTRRAFCMAAFVAAFWLWRYSVNPLRLLMTLALLFLLFNPLLLWQPAWQLSFAGAAGIVLWQPFWQQAANNLPTLLRVPIRLLLVTANSYTKCDTKFT